VCEIVDDGDIRSKAQESVGVRFFDCCSVLGDAEPGEGFQSIEKSRGFCASVSIHDADGDVNTVAVGLTRGSEHLIRFSGAGAHPKENGQSSPICVPPVLVQPPQQHVGIRARYRLF
jgi:hypothetical protein